MEQLFKAYPGYTGMHTQEQAPGAYLNGTRIVKVCSEEGDATPDGMGGKVLGSLYDEKLGHLYFVEWDNRPKVAVGTIALKIDRA